MKKTNLLYSTGIFLLLLTLCSCKKFLDEKSDSKLVVPVTLDDFQKILDDNGLMNIEITPSSGESASDDYFLTEDMYNTNPVSEQHFYKWIYDDYTFQNDWSINYVPVYNSNVCLEGLEKIPVTSSNHQQYNNVKGSALFYRAYSFLNLSWIFSKAYDESTYNSDLGIVLRSGTDFTKPSVRSSVKDCYERIIRDARESLLFLPDSPQHPMRPSKAAAYGLLARTYLSMRKYDSAFHYSNLCLQISNQLIDFNGDPDINGSLSDDVPFMPFNKEIIFFTDMNGSRNLHATYQAFIDTFLYGSYDNNDLRKAAFFLSNNGYEQYKGSYSSNGYGFFTGIATDEMYLIRAECFARGINGNSGDKISALADLNALLIKRYDATSWVPVIATDAGDALVKILLERRKELLMRGLRWIDIKRLNKENASITPKRVVGSQLHSLPPNDNRYAIPLPKDIIDLTGIPQNPK